MLVINSRIAISDHEFSWDFVRSSGKGGQNVNKVNSKAVLRFNVAESPSLQDDVRERFMARYRVRLTLGGELILTSDRHRDRPKNMKDCLEKLKNMILSVATAPKERKATKPTPSSRQKRLDSKRKHAQKKSSRRHRWEED